MSTPPDHTPPTTAVRLDFSYQATGHLIIAVHGDHTPEETQRLAEEVWEQAYAPATATVTGSRPARPHERGYGPSEGGVGELNTLHLGEGGAWGWEKPPRVRLWTWKERRWVVGGGPTGGAVAAWLEGYTPEVYEPYWRDDTLSDERVGDLLDREVRVHALTIREGDHVNGKGLPVLVFDGHPDHVLSLPPAQAAHLLGRADPWTAERGSAVQWWVEDRLVAVVMRLATPIV